MMGALLFLAVPQAQHKLTSTLRAQSQPAPPSESHLHGHFNSDQDEMCPVIPLHCATGHIAARVWSAKL